MARAFQHQHFAEAPRGWRVRSKRAGDHVLRVAFPPGQRRRGAGRLLEILHPKKNPACENGECAIAQNPVEELLIFGNPSKDEFPCPHCKENFTAAEVEAGKLRKHLAEHRRERFGNPGEYLKAMADKLEEQYRAKLKEGMGHEEAMTSVIARKGGDARVIAEFKRRIGNPRKRNAGGIGNHKPGCKCAFCKRARGANPRRRRNQSGDLRQAVSLFGTFHGRDPEEIASIQRSAAMRLEYTALGELEYLIVKPPEKPIIEIDFEGDDIKLASAPNGRQLYLIDGNQSLDSMLGKFTDDPRKDFIDLGEALEVQYDARKIHTNFEPTSWYHKFGEKNGALPRLMYDKLKKEIFFVGGEYFIDTSDAVSPGIEN
jgi:hypothetical protein